MSDKKERPKKGKGLTFVAGEDMPDKTLEEVVDEIEKGEIDIDNMTDEELTEFVNQFTGK